MLIESLYVSCRQLRLPSRSRRIVAGEEQQQARAQGLVHLHFVVLPKLVSGERRNSMLKDMHEGIC